MKTPYMKSITDQNNDYIFSLFKKYKRIAEQQAIIISLLTNKYGMQEMWGKHGERRNTD